MTDFQSRFVVDSRDREAWQIARAPGLGASDVASFAKLSSVDSYVRAKLKSGAFRGNAHTARGHQWEPHALAAYGYTQNHGMYRADDDALFLATPDGIGRTSSAGVRKLAQVKTRMDWNGKPKPADHRQVQWELFVMGPEFQLTDFLVLPIEDGHPAQMTPDRVTIARDDDMISRLLTIAYPVLAALTAAHAFEKAATR